MNVYKIVFRVLSTPADTITIVAKDIDTALSLASVNINMHVGSGFEIESVVRIAENVIVEGRA